MLTVWGAKPTRDTLALFWTLRSVRGVWVGHLDRRDGHVVRRASVSSRRRFIGHRFIGRRFIDDNRDVSRPCPACNPCCIERGLERRAVEPTTDRAELGLGAYAGKR
jgi:hypothetical protein